MYKKIIKYLSFLFMLIPLNCGFEVVNKSKINNFSIQEIRTDGDKRISYRIKNNLLSYSKENSQRNLIIDINTKKTKSPKEKNIKNEITKYEINLDIEILISFIGSGKNSQKKNFKISGDYAVGRIHSTSISNEKKLINSLVENISKKILDEIEININDI